jgi:hypothetical protein
MNYTPLLEIVSDLIEEGRRVIATNFDVGSPRVLYIEGRPIGVDLQMFSKWQAGCTNLLRLLGSAADPWRESFSSKKNTLASVKVSLGTLEGIYETIKKGLLVRFEEMVRAETFESLLEQAEHLLCLGYFPASGVLGRAVLEEHLREWCQQMSCIPAKVKPTISDFCANLYSAKHITKSQMKHIESLASVGNDAAHNAKTLSEPDVRRLLRDIREILAMSSPLVMPGQPTAS